MNAMEEKKSSPSSGPHHPPIPMPQPYPFDLSANSFGLSQQQQQQRPVMHHRHLPPNFAAAPDAARRPGIPPLSPYSQMPPRSPSSSSPSASFHSRSLSQPAFFSLDSFPPLSPPPPSPHGLPPPAPTSMHLPPSEVAVPAAGPDDSLLQPISRTPAGRSSPEGGGGGGSARLPPRKAHRRSQSDIPFGVASAAASGFLFQPPPPGPGTMAGVQRPLQQQQQLVKQESSDWEKEAESGDHRSDVGDVGDDLISAYMNLDNLETFNSCETEERREYMDGSRSNGTRTNNGADSSENEAESSSVNESSGGGERKEGNKRSAAGDLTPINSRHSRSLSMDSLMSKLNFGDESPRLPPSPGNPTGPLSRSGSMDEATANMLNLEFGKGEFNSAELKKIMANEKLAEMALTDPKRVKRILANRQSAARSKERKMRYISELEHKVQTLQTEATTLSAQLTLLQRDSAGLTSQNNELKFRIQSMEQQAQLREALNQALTAEVHRLKLATGEITEAQLSKNMHMNAQVFQMRQLQSQQQQSPQVPCYQMQKPENHQQPQQQNNATSESEEKKS